jgi:outer membrane lipoprotein-sorting protein
VKAFCNFLARVMLSGALLAPFVATAQQPSPGKPNVSADDVVARSRATYSALKSYSDTGTVLEQFGPKAADVYRHTFKTYFRAPRSFLFDFTADARAGGQRIVIWCNGGDYQSWFSATGEHASYPQGSNTAMLPFVQSASKTRGAVTLIPGLIYGGSGLVSAFSEFGEGELAGTEPVTSSAAYKVMGVARSVYPQTHRETNVRPMSVWIDTNSGLLRKIFEDTPTGLPSTAVLRATTTLDPRANPQLDDSVFRFTVPTSQQ